MKNWIIGQFGKLRNVNVKKSTASVVIIAFITNIASPILTYASLPNFGNNLVQGNISAVAQVSEVKLPRDFVANDTVSITLSWSISWQVTLTQTYTWSHLATSQALSDQIDAIADYISVYDDSIKSFVITSENPWIPFSVWKLKIDRWLISPTTPVGNMVAVAQQSELTISQNLFAWDNIDFSIDWLPLSVSFSWSKDQTLQTFADLITASTNASWSYDSANGKINMIAKVAWQAFSMSNLVITSTWISPVNIQPNVVPVKQVDNFSFPRPIYSDETLTFSLSGSNFTQPFNISTDTTLADLASQINTSPIVDASYTWWILNIISKTAWNPFPASSITSSWWKVDWINVTWNQVAIAQVNMIAIPRDLYLWDTINFSVDWTWMSQSFNATSLNTISLLVNKINTLSNVQVTNFNPATRVLTITSTKAWRPFINPSLVITSQINSQNQTLSQAAVAQISEYNFPRSLVAWDNVSTIINWSPYSTNYMTWTNETVQAFADNIASSLSWVISVSSTPTNITLTADTAWTPFTVQPLQITNTLTPKVIVPNITPVKQKETISFPQTLVNWDNISVTIDGNLVTQSFDTDEATTLIALNGKIDAIPSVNSTLDTNTKTITIEAQNAGTSFSISNVLTTSNFFTSTPIVANQTWNKANLNLTVSGTIIPMNFFSVWNCNINFVFSGAAFDFNCADNSATIDTFSINNQDLAHLIANVYNITQTTASWTRNIVSTASWAQITYATSWIEISADPINYDLSWITNNNIVFNSNNAPSPDISQIDTLALPRDFVEWDTFQTSINGITVTQNFMTSSWVSFDNLVSQIDKLPNITATWSSNIITITSKIAWIPFTVWQSRISNVNIPVMWVTNVVAQAQQTEIDFPAAFVSWDKATISIDWTSVSQDFNTDSATTFGDLISNISTNTNVNTSASWSLWIVLTAKNAWTSFVVDKVEIKNTTPVNSLQANLPWIAQVDTLTVPFVPTAWDSLTVGVNWTTVSQDFTNDVFTTFASLNTKLDALPSVRSSVDTASWVFTLTAKTAWVPFNASLIATWALITTTPTVANVDSWAQVDTLTISRNIEAWDHLTLWINWNTGSISFNTNKTTTLQDLTSWINALPELDATFDNIDTITITAATPGNPFTQWTLAINTLYTSVNQVANKPAVAQVDKISLPRTLIQWDKVSINIDWVQINDTFTGTSAITLNNFANLINSAQSWATASISWNDITISASTAWIPFLIQTWSFIVENTSFANTTVQNVVAVKQQSEFDIPTFVAWDQINFSVDSTIISVDFNNDHSTTVNDILNAINAWWAVTATYQSGTTIHMISNVAWTPFSVSQVLIRNTTASNIKVNNKVPVAQVVDFYPAWTLREWVTFRLTVNSLDYDYLTTPTDWISEVVAWVSAAVSNTWVIVSTWSDISGQFVRLTSSVPWIAFTYASNAIDITAPIISQTISTPQRLRSWVTSTSNVQINEDGYIYLVLSWTLANTESDVATAIANWDAFIWASPANNHSDYTITVANWIKDGQYNFVAIDQYHNVSQAIPGWLTVDNTAPIVSIGTPTQSVSTPTITIFWTTEPNTPVVIAWGIGNVNTVSDWAWSFSWVVSLNLDTTNTIVASATDIAWNVWSWSVVIISDTLTPNPFNVNYPSYTNSWSADISIHTETWIFAEIFSWATVVASWMTNWSWDITLNVALDINNTNNFHVVVTDAASNTNSGNIAIVQDSIAPNIIINPYQNLIHAANINI